MTDSSTASTAANTESSALAGVRCLVVGASSGIGAATATLLRDCGARVVGAARRVERIGALGLDGTVACDLLDADSCAAAADAALAILGTIDALVHVAGVTFLAPLADSGADEWQRMVGTNLIGPALVTKALLANLRSPESAGRAIYISSDSARKPYPGLVPYAASKAALEAFAVGLSHEYPELKVTHVMVGPTDDTGMVDAFDIDEITPWVQRWLEEGFIRYGTQKSIDVARVLAQLVADPNPPIAAEAVAPM